MELFTEYCIDKGKELGAKIASYLFTKIYEYSRDKMSKIKYKKILDFSSEFAEKFLNFIDLRFKIKKDYKNDTVFQKFQTDNVKLIINEIFEKENIKETIETRIKDDINELNLNNKSLNILLFGNQKIAIDELFNNIHNLFQLENINDNEFSFNIELKDTFKEIKKINLIKYYENFDYNKEINCIWSFYEKENNEDEEDKFFKVFFEKNIPIIYIYQNREMNKEGANCLPENINFEDNTILKNYNYFEIEFNEINNKENKHIINLIEKSIINILIKQYKIFMNNKTQKVLENIFKSLKFDSGNKIDNINILTGQFLKKIFSILLFKEKNISPFAKAKIKELLNKYKEYLKSYEESYFSEFVKKGGDEYISKIKESINKRNTNLNKKQNLTEEERENMEILDELEHCKIDFIEAIDINKKEKPKDDQVNEDDFNSKLKIKFNDYYIENASKYIIELVVLFIKNAFIKCYKICSITKLYEFE